MPGCRHGAHVDVHHLERRAEGGGHELENLVTLCTAHHAAAHRGLLVIRREGEAFRFERADGRPYGAIFGAETKRCADLSRHFEAIVEATGSERMARRALGGPVAPGSQPEGGGPSRSGFGVAPPNQAPGVAPPSQAPGVAPPSQAPDVAPPSQVDRGSARGCPEPDR